MSVDAKINIRPVADKASATAAGRQIAEAVQQAVVDGSAKGGGGGFSPLVNGGGSPAGGAPQNPAAQNSQMRDWGRIIATEFARIAGSKIAQFVGGFMLHEGLSTAFRLSRTPGENNTVSEIAEAGATSAIAGGQAGAMLGAGPAGIVVGALLGGLNAVVLKQKEIADELKQISLDYKRERWNEKRNAEHEATNTLFNRSLSYMAPRAKTARLAERLQERIGYGADKDTELKRFNKEYDLWSSVTMVRDPKEQIAMQRRWDGYTGEIMSHLLAAANGKYTDDAGRLLNLNGNDGGTRQYLETIWEIAQRLQGKGFEKFGKDGEMTKRIKQELDRVNSEIQPLQTAEFNSYLDRYDLMRSNAVAHNQDDMMRKGMGVGASIDVTTVPKQQLEVLKRIEDLIRNPKAGDPMAQMRDEFAKFGG